MLPGCARSNRTAPGLSLAQLAVARRNLAESVVNSENMSCRSLANCGRQRSHLTYSVIPDTLVQFVFGTLPGIGFSVPAADYVDWNSMMSLPVFQDTHFERLLGRFRMEVIHFSENTIYGVRPDLTLAYVNLGWQHFASQNGGEPNISSEWNLGCCIENAIAPILRPFFLDNFAKCLRENRPWEHLYDCSSAELYRKFCMKTFPLGHNEGLLIVHSLVREIPQTGLTSEPLEENYRNEEGLVIQCCHCRRVRRNDTSNLWDWIPEWVTSPLPYTSHGLCDPCSGFYYPPQDDLFTQFPETFRTVI